jgi:hypothetical protein
MNPFFRNGWKGLSTGKEAKQGVESVPFHSYSRSRPMMTYWCSICGPTLEILDEVQWSYAVDPLEDSCDPKNFTSSRASRSPARV